MRRERDIQVQTATPDVPTARRQSIIAVSYMNMTDMREAVAIDRESFPHQPWTLDDFRFMNSRPYTTCKVADMDGHAAGYVVYTMLRCKGLFVERIGVAADARRRGVGRMLIEHVVRVLRHSDARKVIALKVREGNLDAQLFYRSLGFKCVRVSQGHYAYLNEDAYVFELNVGDGAEPECSGR